MSGAQLSAGRNPLFVYYRVLALLCILLHHSFSAWFGSWPPNRCFHADVSPFLSSVSTLAKYVGLGCFTFMAGYFAFASMQKYRPFLFVKKKVQHILIPCVVWGAVYYLLFPQYMMDNSPVNGTHLWYLPMIFLCFLIALPIGYVRHVGVGIGCALAALLFVRVGGYAHIIPHDSWFRPVRDLTPFLPVFVCGCLAGRYPKSHRLQMIFQGGIVLGVFLLFLLKGKDICCYLHILFPVVLYSFIRMSQSEQLPLPSALKSFDKNSFSIYLFHQFVINLVVLLTDKGFLPSACPWYFLFVMAVVFSWMLAVGYGKLMSLFQTCLRRQQQERA